MGVGFGISRLPVTISPSDQKMGDRIIVRHVGYESDEFIFGQKGVDCDGWLPCYLCWQP
jgi:hypothetical protein